MQSYHTASQSNCFVEATEFWLRRKLPSPPYKRILQGLSVSWRVYCGDISEGKNTDCYMPAVLSKLQDLILYTRRRDVATNNKSGDVKVRILRDTLSINLTLING
jgi:hypothetical protein